MAFQRLPRTTKRLGDQPATITIGSSAPTRNGQSRQMYLFLSVKTRQMLGEPAAIFLDWDPEEWKLRVSVAPKDAEDAYPTSKTNRIGITTAAREAGLLWDVPVTVKVKPQGRTAVVGDFSQVRTITPIKRGRAA